MRFIWIILIIICFPMLSIAQNLQNSAQENNTSEISPAPETGQPTNTTNMPTANMPAVNNTADINNTPADYIITCPAPSELVRNPNTLKWEGKDPKRWIGYEMSFETHLATFGGAQWHGTKIGQIFCLYHGSEVTSFPVLILFHAEVNEPNGGKWSTNLGDYRNCVSSNLQDCSFMPTPAPAEKNPYEELQQMKDNGSSQELGF